MEYYTIWGTLSVRSWQTLYSLGIVPSADPFLPYNTINARHLDMLWIYTWLGTCGTEFVRRDRY